jgi:hypothetical protein
VSSLLAAHKHQQHPHHGPWPPLLLRGP